MSRAKANGDREGRRTSNENTSPAKGKGADTPSGSFADLYGDDPSIERIDGPQRSSPPAAPAPGKRRPRDQPPSPATEEPALRSNGFVSVGLPKSALRDLRMGRIRPDMRVDLHRLDRQQAQRALLRAFGVASAHSQRCVLVIHGRGKGSPHGAETLKESLPGWLAEPPLQAYVLAFAPAVRRDGGEGASYIMVRKHERLGKVSGPRRMGRR